MDALDYSQLEKLADEYGSAFYLLDADQFAKNLQQFKAAFQKYYARTNIGYSYKTNYVPLLCHIARKLGCYAEVVSPFEYELAVRFGNNPDRIIYNGPVKPFDSIENAVRDGSIVNLDSLEEYQFVERLASRQPGEEFSIGLRCNVGIEPEEGSRFGIQVANGELDDVLDRINAAENIKVVSLHTHFSYRRDVSSYASRTRRLAEVLQKHHCHHSISVFDVGGGFFGPVPDEIVTQFSSPPPTYDEYAKAIGPIVAESFGGLDNPPELVLEPGVGVVANALSFVCRIESIKRSHSRIIANSTGSVQNIKPSKSRFNLPLRVVVPADAERDGSEVPIDICGYTCMEDDVLFHAFPGTVGVGDYLVFNNVGAYSLTFKPQFIRTAPAILWRESSSSEWRLARRQETVDDVLSTYSSSEPDA